MQLWLLPLIFKYFGKFNDACSIVFDVAMCGSLLSKFKKSSNRIKSSSGRGLQNRKRATKFAGHPTEVQLRSPIKKIFEEHEKKPRSKLSEAQTNGI